MGLYEVPLSMSLLGFGMVTMLHNCLVCHDFVSCYFYFVLLPLGPELW